MFTSLIIYIYIYIKALYNNVEDDDNVLVCLGPKS
jgi:hypothetical protein